jgi:hypothetical protein
MRRSWATAYIEQDVSLLELLETIRDVARRRPKCLRSLLTQNAAIPATIFGIGGRPRTSLPTPNFHFLFD